VAKRESADSASAVTRGSLEGANAADSFSNSKRPPGRLKPGAISAPVLTSYGYRTSFKMDQRQGDQPSFAISCSASCRATHPQLMSTRAPTRSSIDPQSGRPPNSIMRPRRWGSRLQSPPHAQGGGAFLNGRKCRASAPGVQRKQVGESERSVESDTASIRSAPRFVTRAACHRFEAATPEIRRALATRRAIESLGGDSPQLATQRPVHHSTAAKADNVSGSSHHPSPGRASCLIRQMTEAIGAAFTLPTGTVSTPVKTATGRLCATGRPPRPG